MSADSKKCSQRGLCGSTVLLQSYGFWLGFGAVATLLVLALIALQFLDNSAKSKAQIAWARSEATRELELNLLDYTQAVRAHAQEGGQESRMVAGNAAASLEKYLEVYIGHVRTDRQRQLSGQFTTLWLELKNHSQLLLNQENPPPDPEDLAKLDNFRLGLKNFLDNNMQPDAVGERKAREQSLIPFVRTALNFSLFALLLFAGLIVVLSLVASTVLDASESKIVLDEPHRGESRGRAILPELLPQIIWASRVDGAFTYCNQSWFAYTGLDARESRGNGWTLAIDPDFRQEALNTWDAVRAKGAEFEVEIPLRRADGAYRWHLVRGTPLQDEEGKITRWVGLVVDIHDHRQAKQIEEYQRQLEEVNTRMERLSTTDGLTRLKNRRVFEETLNEEVQWAVRYGTQLSLLLLDVDHFKQYNEDFGRPAGDTVLREVARLLKKTARTTDFVARYGGGEFAILLPGTDQQGAATFAEKIRRTVEVGNWSEREVTVSIGVATLNTDNSDGTAMVEEAEVSLYLGKRSGRNCVYIAADHGTQDYFRPGTSWPRPKGGGV